MKEFEGILPVEPPGKGNAAADYRFLASSVRQQRLFARSMELRLGEYLGRYDNVRASSVDEAYRAGDVDQVTRSRGCMAALARRGSPCLMSRFFELLSVAIS